MIEYNRSTIPGNYHAIRVFECPINIVMLAAKLGSSQVTVENYSHYRNPGSLHLLINHAGLTIKPKLKQFLADFQISRDEFISLQNIWDTQGVYAVFHESADLKFKASDLNETARYRALDHFKWNLEMAIPDSASDGWSQIVSPDVGIIDKIENVIKNLG